MAFFVYSLAVLATKTAANSPFCVIINYDKCLK